MKQKETVQIVTIRFWTSWLSAMMGMCAGLTIATAYHTNEMSLCWLLLPLLLACWPIRLFLDKIHEGKDIINDLTVDV